MGLHDDYEVLREISRGGAGAVLHARDRRLGREVAIKLLLVGAEATPRQRQRFLNEARALARIHHPNVVRVFDVGEHEGQPYLVMDFVKGESLQERIKDSPLPVGEALRVGTILAWALEASHVQGILHRDLKPANVLIDLEGRPLLTDFGLTQVLGDEQALRGRFQGTPGFCAPEQAQGEIEHIGPASDVYGLAATLYCALTQQAPVEGSSLPEIVVATISRVPTSPCELRPEVPASFASLLLRCLAKDLAQRPPSAAAFARLLGEATPEAIRERFAVQVTRPRSDESGGGSVAPTEGRRYTERLVLETELQHGSATRVYLAYDSDLQRQVVVKVLGAEVEGEARQRFAREARLAATLDHPRIVHVHSVGEVEAESYIVYELVPGARSLDEAWEDADLERRIEFLLDAAEGLAYAHDRGVVHRDVHPGNILVNAEGHVFVADFGVATAFTERLTRTGEQLGTPSYMAPEQIEGRRDLFSPATDVWGLGVLLYLALTDELPFRGESQVELGSQILAANPQPPRDRARGVPRALESVCLRALARDPSDRFSDAGAMALALRQARERPRREWRPAAAALLVTALAALGGAVLAGRSAGDPATQAVLTLPDSVRTVRSRFELRVPLRGPVREAWVNGARAEVEGDEVHATLELSQLGEHKLEVRCVLRDGSEQRQALRVERVAALARAGRLVAELHERALGGDAVAAAHLAQHLAQGEGVARDPVAAKEWVTGALAELQRRAEDDEWPAVTALGMLYERGLGVREDPSRAQQLLERGAQAGQPLAMSHLARLYQKLGREERRVEWLQKAAGAGEGRAMQALGEALFVGSPGLPADASAGMRWLTTAAESGRARAMRRLARLLGQGTHCEPDPAHALAWTRRAAEAGDATAWESVGVLLEEGRGRRRDPQGALEAYRRGVAAGDLGAVVRVGILHTRREGPLPYDLGRARRLFEQAIAGGSVPGKRELARLLLAGPVEHHPRALSLLEEAREAKDAGAWLIVASREAEAPMALDAYRRAAAAGDVHVNYTLGTLYREGKGIGRREPKVALEWFERGADLGDLACLQELAAHHSSGPGRDLKIAFACQRRAALLGSPSAMYALAKLYTAGKGTRMDEALAGQWLLRAAEAGEAAAFSEVAERYARGKGVEKDVARAVELLTQGAAAGDAPCAYRLGLRYRSGEGVPKDLSRSRQLLEQAAKAGSAAAMHALGEAYLRSLGVAQDLALAFRWFLQGAEGGEEKAYSFAGRMLRRGEGVTQDLVAAAKWYRKGAELQDPASVFGYALMKEKGEGMPRDLTRAVVLYSSLGTEHVEALVRLGWCYREGGSGLAKNSTTSARWFREAAERKHPEAIGQFGWCTYYGLGTRPNHAKAADYFREGVALGDAFSAAYLGLLHQHGHGVEKNMSEAVRLYRVGVERGSSDAMLSLAGCFTQGLGVERSPEKALALYKRSGEGGNSLAMSWVGWHYRSGVGTKRDLKQAAKWHGRAAAAGNGTSQNTYGEMLLRGEGGLTRDAKAAVDWFRKAAVSKGSMAMRNLGRCLLEGLGTRKAPIEAVGWLMKSAAKDDREAMRLLASCYAQGKGTKADLKLAHSWYTRAADKGDVPALFWLAGAYASGRGAAKDDKRALDLYRQGARKSSTARALAERLVSLFPPDRFVPKALTFDTPATRKEIAKTGSPQEIEAFFGAITHSEVRVVRLRSSYRNLRVTVMRFKDKDAARKGFSFVRAGLSQATEFLGASRLGAQALRGADEALSGERAVLWGKPKRSVRIFVCRRGRILIQLFNTDFSVNLAGLAAELLRVQEGIGK